jgi:2-(1,2-epoxy-1,2-dihydrophenyl)acetyl-CoA isomerase
MPDQSYETIRYEARESVAWIRLSRPDVLNALDARVRSELLRAFKDAGRDASVRAVVVTGEGRAFCAGADLRGGASEREFRRVIATEYNPLIRAIRDLPKPVVVAVNGVAAGAGMSLALAADLIVAAEEARFVAAFARIGLVPDSGLSRVLVRAVGRHQAFAILLGEAPLTARAAADLGLVATVVPGGELEAAASELAERLASGPTRGIGLTKRLLNAAEDLPLPDELELEAALQELAGRTEDHAEGVAAFTEKREPRFSGR